MKYRASNATRAPFVNVRTSKGSVVSQWAALGGVYACNSVRYYWDGSLFQSLSANVAHDSFDPITQQWGYLPEPALTVTTKWTADFSQALWVKSGGITRANATSCISGQVASKLTAAASTDNISQIGATSTSSTQMADCYVEKGTAATSRLEVYNGTSLTAVGNAIINWSTLTVTSTLGTNFSMQFAGVGPNGGALFLLVAFATSVTSGNIRSFRFFPDTSGGGGYCYLHYGSCVIGTSATFSPVVTNASQFARAAMTFPLPLSGIKAFSNLKGVTLVIDALIPYNNGLQRVGLQMTGATTSERISISMNASTGIFAGLMVNTSSSSPTDVLAAPTTQTRMIFAGSFRSGNACIAKQGKLLSNRQASLAFPTLLTADLGNLSTGSLQFSGYIFGVQLYNAIPYNQLSRVTLK